jgi:hypothetical protein
VRYKLIVAMIMLLPACTVVTTSDPQWEWPQDIKNIE